MNTQTPLLDVILDAYTQGMRSKSLNIFIICCATAVLLISVKWYLNDSGNPEAQIAPVQAVAGLMALMGGLAWWKKRGAPKVTDPFTVSYMRLFGAVEVPLLMSLIGHDGPFPKFREMPSYRKSPGGLITEEMHNFWRKKWTYRKAMPVLNAIWSTYCGDRWSGVNLYFNSLLPTEEDLLTFCSCIEVDAACSLASDVAEHHHLSYDRAWYPDGGTGTKPSDIAFLFVILQNKTGATLEDIELNCRSYTNPLQLRPYESRHLFDPISKMLNPEHEALNDQLIDLAAPMSDSKKVALLNRNESLIIALSAYRSNKEGFPHFYLTDVTVPIEVSASVKGVIVNQQIRKPFLDKAAKVLVPNGWFHQ